MSYIDGDDYSPFRHSKTVSSLDPGVLYPGGAHRTWGKTKVPQPYRPNVTYSPEPSGAAAARRRDTAEEKQRLRAGERLHSTDPSDPWAEASWSPCEADCPIHNQ